MSKIKISKYHFLQHITVQIKEVHYTIHFVVMFPNPSPPPKKKKNTEKKKNFKQKIIIF